MLIKGESPCTRRRRGRAVRLLEKKKVGLGGVERGGYVLR